MIAHWLDSSRIPRIGLCVGSDAPGQEDYQADVTLRQAGFPNRNYADPRQAGIGRRTDS